MKIYLEDGAMVETPGEVSEFGTANENIDVWVTLRNGEVYGGTIYTLQNIRALMEKNRCTGEEPQSYHWDASFVVTDEISVERVKVIAEELIRTGDIFDAFDSNE